MKVIATQNDLIIYIIVRDICINVREFIDYFVKKLQLIPKFSITCQQMETPNGTQLVVLDNVKNKRNLPR